MLRRLFQAPILAGILAGLLILGGCTGNDSGAGEVKEIFLSDVTNAKRLAEASDDRLAVLCYTYLEEKAAGEAQLASLKELEKEESFGVVSAYQVARNTRRRLSGLGEGEDFRIACGPLVSDSRRVILRFGVRGALPF